MRTRDIFLCLFFHLFKKNRPDLKSVLSEAVKLERDLCEGVRSGVAPVNSPIQGARLAFYITSLTKRGSQRNAAMQLKLALPINLFLNLQARKWASFYVRT